MALQSSSSPSARLQAGMHPKHHEASVNLFAYLDDLELKQPEPPSPASPIGVDSYPFPDSSQESGHDSDSTSDDTSATRPRSKNLLHVLKKLRPLTLRNSKDRLSSTSQLTLPNYSYDDDAPRVPSPLHREKFFSGLDGIESPNGSDPELALAVPQSEPTIQRDNTNQQTLSDKHLEAITHELFKRAQQPKPPKPDQYEGSLKYSSDSTSKSPWKDFESQIPTEKVHHRAGWKYESKTREQLSFEENEVFLVSTKLHDGWWYGRRLMNGESGWIPSSYFDPRPISSPVVAALPRRQGAFRERKALKRRAVYGNVEPTKDDSLQLYRQVSQMLLVSRECLVCGESKACAEFPDPARVQCDHEWKTCRDCVRSWIATELQDKGWEHIKCPELDCKAILNHSDVSHLADANTFQRYDALATRAHLSSIPNFRWCLSPRCQSGQIHDTEATGPIFKCAACQMQFCMQHRMAWHRGETCQQFDWRVRNERQIREDEATVQMLARTTKKCPGKHCGWLIEKNNGCDHMKCTKCRHEFCWVCLASYDPIRKHGNLRHNYDCTYHSDNVR